MENNQKPTPTQNIVAGIVAICIFIFIFNLVNSGTSDLLNSTNEGNSSNLTVVDSRCVNTGYGTMSICGTVKNNSSKNVGYAQVEITLYDKAGNTVGSTMDNITNLEPNGTWKFKAPIIEENVASYKIKNVTGY